MKIQDEGVKTRCWFDQTDAVLPGNDGRDGLMIGKARWRRCEDEMLVRRTDWFSLASGRWTRWRGRESSLSATAKDPSGEATCDDGTDEALDETVRG